MDRALADADAGGVALGGAELSLAVRCVGADLTAARAVVANFEAKRSIVPDTATYNALIRVAGWAGDVDAVAGFVRAMTRAGAAPDSGTCRALAEALAARNVDLASEMVAEADAAAALARPAARAAAAAARRAAGRGARLPPRSERQAQWSLFPVVRADDAARSAVGAAARPPLVLDLHGHSRAGAAVVALSALRKLAAAASRGGPAAAPGVVFIVGQASRPDIVERQWGGRNATAAGASAGGLGDSLVAFLASIGLPGAKRDPSNAGRVVLQPGDVAAWVAADAAVRARVASRDVVAKQATLAAAAASVGLGVWWVVPQLL